MQPLDHATATPNTHPLANRSFSFQGDLSVMPRLSIEAVLALIGLVITVPGLRFAYLQCRFFRQARRTAQLPSKLLYHAPSNYLGTHLITHGFLDPQFGSPTGLPTMISTVIKSI